MMTPERIAQIRHELGLSQRQFAELVGVHMMTVSKWERGINPISAPTARLIEMIRAIRSNIRNGAESMDDALTQ